MAAHRLDSLTALRFPAALMVFGLHATAAYETGAIHRLLGQGSVGVSYFFVLSGFVLAWSQRGGDTARWFYRRRFARVWPIHAVTWAAAGLVIALGSAGFTALGAVLSLGLVQSWVPDEDVYYAMNAPSWSLACEAFFYLLFPILIAPITRASSRQRWTLMAAAALGVLALAAAVTPLEPHTFSFWLVYIFPPTRLLEFVIGMALAVEIRRGWRPPVPVPIAVGLALAGYLAAGWVPTSFGLVAVTLVPFALLIAATATGDLAGRRSVLHARWLVTLGVWSYAFYLVHRVVLTGLRQVNNLGTLPQALVGLVLAIAAAAVLHLVVERPAEHRLRASPEPVA